MVVFGLLASCACDSPDARDAARPLVLEHVETVELPTASRDDLPASTPAITITIGPRTFAVSNRALVATWPPPERDAVPHPIVERTIEDQTDTLDVPALVVALSDAIAVERRRVAFVGASGVTTVFALRAASDVHFGRVLAAIHAAGAVGLSAPRFALASASGERALTLAVPRSMGEAPDPDVAAEVAALVLREGGEPLEPLDPGLAAPAPRVYVSLDTLGLVVRRGERRLGPGCTALASDATSVTIPVATFVPAAITACIGAIDDHSAIVFDAASDRRYGDVIEILETLARLGDVGLAITPALSPTSDESSR